MLQVSFPCRWNDKVAKLVAKLAAKHLSSHIGDQEAEFFLRELSTRRGENPGSKGGMSLWGVVGNYIDEDEFVESLREFWAELLTAELDGGPYSFEQVIALCQHEQDEFSTAFEIRLLFDADSEDGPGPLVIVKHTCPFHWGL